MNMYIKKNERAWRGKQHIASNISTVDHLCVHSHDLTTQTIYSLVYDTKSDPKLSIHMLVGTKLDRNSHSFVRQKKKKKHTYFSLECDSTCFGRPRNN